MLRLHPIASAIAGHFATAACSARNCDSTSAVNLTCMILDSLTVWRHGDQTVAGFSASIDENMRFPRRASAYFQANRAMSLIDDRWLS